MKKTSLTIILSMLASVASALSFDWSTADLVEYGGETLKNAAVSGYVIYLESGSYATSYAINKDTTAESLANSMGTVVGTTSGTTRKGLLTDTATFTYGTYKNDDVFGLLLAYTVDSKTYFNIASSTYTLSNIADETSTPPDAEFAVSFSGPSSKSSVSAGGGWTAVPEPSTAALALAGLALLLKRRKA